MEQVKTITTKVLDFFGPAAVLSLAVLLPTALRSTGENHAYISWHLLDMVVKPLLVSWLLLFVFLTPVFYLTRKYALWRFGLVRILAGALVLKIFIEMFLDSSQRDLVSFLGSELNSNIAPEGGKRLKQLLEVIAVGLLYWWRDRLVPGKLYSFLTLITVTFAVLLTWRLGPELVRDFFQNRVLPAPAEGTIAGPRRVVWIIFDEWDYKITFESDAIASLPTFRELMTLGVFAQNAVSPSMWTETTIPSLLLGRSFSSSRRVGFGRLELTETGSNKIYSFADEISVFHTVKRLNGTNSALGFYHNYCAVFHRVMDRCTSLPIVGYAGFSSPARIGLDRLTFRLASTLSEPFGLAFRQEQMTDISSVQADWIANTNFGTHTLEFLHLNVPHRPAQYAYRVLGSTDEVIDDGYLLNLRYSDRVMASILRSLRASTTAGTDTLLIVSSDHGLRGRGSLPGTTSDKLRVPFIAVLSNQKGNHVTNVPFSTVHTRRLVENYLLGKISSHDDILRFVELSKMSGPIQAAEIQSKE